ncbi:MAG: hypothetical protein SO054_05895, partial [Ruminococcus callidus]|nr:hypothetical protein [Ruminococcus callidus]
MCKSTFKIMEGRREVFRGIPFQNMFGNTAQRASGDFARHLLANFPSEPVSYLPARILRAYFPRYFGKILENP